MPYVETARIWPFLAGTWSLAGRVGSALISTFSLANKNESDAAGEVELLPRDAGDERLRVPTRRIIVSENAALADEICVEVGNDEVIGFRLACPDDSFDPRRVCQSMQYGAVGELFGHLPADAVDPEQMPARRA